MFNPAPSYQSKLLIKIAQSGRGRGHAAGGTTVASRAGAMPCEYRTPTPGVRPASVRAIGLLPRHTTPLRRGPGLRRERQSRLRVQIARKIKLTRDRRVRLLHVVRSVLSVLAGIAVLTLASFAIEAALNPLLLRAFPEVLPGPEALSSNPWVRALTFGYGLMCVAAGGYIAARVASRLPVVHAVVMGIIQASLTILAMLSPVGNHASRLQWIITAVLSIPAALVGGVVYKGRKPNAGLEKAPASA